MKYTGKYWDKAALILIMAVTGFLCFYAIGREGYSNQYYAAAVKSMLSSWHNFFFASFDPGGYVTVDKPALGLWLQAISAFIFGFHGWSLILPEALSAIISVALIFHIVSRSFGKAIGIASAFILGLTPILVAVSRTNNFDSSLVMVLLFAAWALLVAAEKKSLKLLILSMALAGIGFNIKMLEAFMVLPAFYFMYMFVSKMKIINKILHLAGATAVLLVVSLFWAVIVDMTPGDKRPYVGGSKTNSVIELALGYNGIQRLTGDKSRGTPGDGSRVRFQGGSMPGAGGRLQPQGGSMQGAGGRLQPQDENMPVGGQGSAGFFNSSVPGEPVGGGGPGGTQENGPSGIFRIFNQNLSGQISWFLLMAFLGILILSMQAFGKGNNRDTKTLRYLILFGTWIITMIAFFSIAAFYHRYYLCMLAPGIAALAGIGMVEMWKVYMENGWKWLLLPLAILANAGIQVLILSRYTEWDKYLIIIVGSVCIVAAVVLTVIRLVKKENLRNAIKITVAAAFISMLAAPAAWSYTPVMYGSQTTLPVAGPELARGGGMGQDGGSLPSQLVDFLLSKYNGEKYLVAVADANTAAPIMLQTGKPVMAVGGFTGTDNILTVERLAQMVEDGEIRFFEIGGRGMGSSIDITAWVIAHGKAVNLDGNNNSSFVSGNGNGNSNFGRFRGIMGNRALYDLASGKR